MTKNYRGWTLEYKEGKGYTAIVLYGIEYADVVLKAKTRVEIERKIDEAIQDHESDEDEKEMNE